VVGAVSGDCCVIENAPLEMASPRKATLSTKNKIRDIVHCVESCSRVQEVVPIRPEKAECVYPRAVHENSRMRSTIDADERMWYGPVRCEREQSPSRLLLATEVGPTTTEAFIHREGSGGP